MCIYRIKYNNKWLCGKRVPLECRVEVCPFGPEKYAILVRQKEKDVKYFWVHKRVGEVEKVDDVEEAVKKVRDGEGEYIVRGMVYRITDFFRGKSKKASSKITERII